tara:strand:+ start:24 stop:524 length:501 start_codon:yes stop_codon:yes gene_type:complete
MAFSLDPKKFLAEAAEFQESQPPSLMGGVGFGQNLYRKAGFEDFGESNLVAPISNLGSEGLGQTPMREAAREYRFAGDSLLALAQIEAEEKLLEGQKDAYNAARKGQKKGGLFSGIGKAIGTLAPIAISALCDERVKHDIAPLQYSEVNDNLAQMAFAVQEIRGYS